MPTVDVVIPYYNTPIAYTEQTLRSVIDQTFDDWRVFIVNDGSTDQFSGALERLVVGIDDARIAYVRTPNRGCAAARNRGIALGAAPYVAFLDADDYWYPQKLERQLREFRTRPTLALTYSNVDLLMQDGRMAPSSTPARAISRRSPSEQLSRMLRGNFIGVVTVIVRRTSLDAAGRFDESLKTLEDKDLWVRMLIRKWPLAYVDEPLAVYRMHDSNISRNTARMLEGRLRLIENVGELFERYGQSWPELNWAVERRAMLAHAYHEAAEGYIDSREFRSAWRHALNPATGWTRDSTRLALRAALGAVRDRCGLEART